MSSETLQPLLTHPPKAYKQRWYILSVFSLVSVLQNAIWNTWGPIDHAVNIVFGWEDDRIALFANLGSMVYVVAFFPAIYCVQRNIRWAMIFCSGFMAIGTILRAALLQDTDVSDASFVVSCDLCAILNGISNIILCSAPLVISSAWFPPNERVMATSIGQVSNGLGIGMSFLLASQFVRPIDTTSDISTEEILILKRDILWYMYSNAIPSGIFFIMICIYFPAAPPSPPSISSGHNRLNFISGFIEIAKKPSAWIIAIGASIPQGIVIAWTAMMVVNLTHVCSNQDCLTEDWVKHLGIYVSLVSSIIAILVAKASDWMYGFLKLTTIILLFSATLVFSFLCLTSVKVIQFENLSTVKIWVIILLLLGTSFVIATMPLVMELAMEICYPAPEGVVGGWITIWFNIITVVFLSVFSIHGIGTSWMDYVLPATCLLALPFMIIIKEEYNRSNVEKEPDYNG